MLVSGPRRAPAKYCTYDSAASTCSRDASFFGGKAVLPEGAGYGIVIGFGLFFSVATGIIMGLDKRYRGTNVSSSSSTRRVVTSRPV